MKSVLNELRPGDRFNILRVAGDAQLWRPDMAAQENEDDMGEALRFVDGLVANGCNEYEKIVLSLK